MTSTDPIAWAIYGRKTGFLRYVVSSNDEARDLAEYYDVVPLYPAPTPSADDVREALYSMLRWGVEDDEMGLVDRILTAFEVRPRGTVTDTAPLSEHVEGVMYADDIPEGTDYLPGAEDPIPEDYERHYCESDGEDWPCTTVAAVLKAGYRPRGTVTDAEPTPEQILAGLNAELPKHSAAPSLDFYASGNISRMRNVLRAALEVAAEARNA